MLLTILIVVDNYKSYRDYLLFGHPMFCIAFTLNLLYGSIMRITYMRSLTSHEYCSNTLLDVWLQQQKE